jgi:hypothetical protein
MKEFYSVNETEESDCAIVPMNQPNKGGVPKGSPTAEVGEARAWTKEKEKILGRQLFEK